MSIMQELQDIRKLIGENEYNNIETFLKQFPNYLLSDVYYNKEVYEQFTQWKSQNGL